MTGAGAIRGTVPRSVVGGDDVNTKGLNMEQASKWDWVTNAAQRIDELDSETTQIREAMHSHSDTRRILQQWATLVDGLGVLRSRDSLQISSTPFMEWRFCPTSSGAYLDGTLHVIVSRDEVTHRATLRVRESVRIEAGIVSRYQDELGADRSAGVYICDTVLPDKAREIVNHAITQAWEFMGESLADILAESVAYEAAKELREGNTYKVRRLIADYGQVK